MKATNQFTVTGRLAQDARIIQFANSTKASFNLAISRIEKRGEEDVRVVAYQQCQMWRKNGSTDSFDILTKGQLVEISGWVKSEEYVDKTGTRRHSIIFAVNRVSLVEPEKKNEGEQITSHPSVPRRRLRLSSLFFRQKLLMSSNTCIFLL